MYFFKGMICFYGQHYFCYFRDFDAESGSDCWTRYDDSIVRKFGSWDDVMYKCMVGREKPILLLFEQLPTEDTVQIAKHKHYLNELIGEVQWRDMFKQAEEMDQIKKDDDE